MDRHLPPHPADRPPYGHHHAPPPSNLPPPYHMQTAQPPAQIPFADPFTQHRDPFRPHGHERGASLGLAGRGWPPAQGHAVAAHHEPAHHHPLPPPPPPHHQPNGLNQMPLPYDPSRRRSIGGAGSPPQYAARRLSFADLGAIDTADRRRAGPFEPSAAPPPPFPTRNMPPPSPPQMQSSSSTSSVMGAAPRGPPTASPFAGIRDLASLSSSHRPAGGMSISSILGGGDDSRRPGGSPHGSAALPSGPHQGMQPPSPGRARSSSMREGYHRGVREHSPGRLGMLGEPRSASAALGHDRFGADTRRDGMFRSPQLPRESAHSFRAFRAPPEQSPNVNGNGAPARPSSQPVEPGPTRSIDEIMRREDPMGGRLGVFRAFGDGPHKMRGESTPRHDFHPYQNGAGPTSQPSERSVFGSPASRHEPRDMHSHYPPGAFGPPTREEQMGMFRPAYQPPAQTVLDQARESIEARPQQDFRRDMQRATPPLSDFAPMNRYRNGYHERPLTLEEHQRMEALNRDFPQRKESDGSMHRSLFNISPDLERKGRNSPLPQAVQGAQPRHVGPGGDHPGIKSEFGRMFSGLGSGVGSATPVAGQSANGTTTPSRLSPSRQVDGNDLARAELEDGRGSKTGKGSKKNGRRSREDGEAEIYDGRMTPSLSQRGNKRTKTAAHHHHHHGHHHHHHHHEPIDAQPSPFNMLRFNSNPLSHTNATPAAPHHHHHHHGAHAHPGHHHHHAPRSVPAPRMPSTIVDSKQLMESVVHLPRNNLGFHLYDTEISRPSSKAPLDHRLPYASTMRPLPRYEGKENCTLTVRVPRWYLSRSSDADSAPSEAPRFEEICKRRHVFGTDVYTDDSDVIAAAVHSGWLKGDFGDLNEDLHDLDPEAADDREHAPESSTAAAEISESPLSLSSKPPKPIIPPPNHDAHVTLLLLPALQSYASSSQHHMLSREWKDVQHDGMSYAIHRIEFVDEGDEGRNLGRSASARKNRIRAEELKRQEAARGLLMLPGLGQGAGGKVVRAAA